MHIQSAQLTGIKNKTGKIALQPANMIVKPNGGGKTALFSAIHLALLGYIPGETALKTNADIARLASGPEIGVRLNFSDGTESSIGFESKGKTWKAVGDSPAWVDDGMKFLLDPRSYFGQSPNAKMAIGLRMLAGEERYPVAAIEKKLAAVMLKSHGEDAKAFVTSYTAKAKGVAAAHASDALRLAALEEWLKANLSKAKDFRDRMENTAQGSSDLAGINTELQGLPSEEALAQKERDAETLIGTSQRTIGALQQAKKDYEDSAERYKELLAIIKRIETLDGLKIELQTAQTSQKEWQENETALNNQAGKIRAEIEAIKKQADALNEASQPVISKYDEETEAAGAWVTWEWPKHGIGHHQMRGKGVVDKEGTVVNFIPSEVFTDAARTISDEAYSAAQEQAAKAANLYALAEDKGEQVDEKLSEASEAKQNREEFAKQAKEVQSELAAVEKLALKQSDFEKERDAIESGTASPDEAALAAEQAHLAKLEEQREALRQLKNKRASITAKIAAAEEAQKEFAKAKVETDVLTAMQKAVQAMRGDFVDHNFDGALALANRITKGLKFGDGGINTIELCYRDGELGTMREGIFVEAQSAFSGSEKRAAAVAIGVALASKSKFKLALIDELSEFDDSNGNRSTLVRNLCELVKEGVLHQFIVADSRKLEGPAPAELNVIA